MLEMLFFGGGGVAVAVVVGRMFTHSRDFVVWEKPNWNAKCSLQIKLISVMQGLNILLETSSDAWHRRPGFEVYCASKMTHHVNVNFLQRCHECICHNRENRHHLL
jgi:hypothetical protein